MSDRSILLADIGGTNARFALATQTGVGFQNAKTLQCADYPSATDAMRRYLEIVSAPKPVATYLAAAGPVINETLVVTNNHWTLSASEIRSDFGVENVRLLNDFEAIARSIPHIGPDDLESVGSVSHRTLAKENFSVAIVGPGTGFGISGLFAREGGLFPIVGEGGHTNFAPKSKIQIELLEVLRDKFERVSLERLLSGPGIENIYWALQTLRKERCKESSATEIFAAAANGSDHSAADAVQLFFEVLGQVAGDVALMMGATDGVYIAGGITKRYPEMLHISGFRNAFESKGHHRSLMERIPTHLITYDEPGLMGAASLVQ